MNCAQAVISNEPTFVAYYAKKRAEGKEHRVALTHVAKKLLRVIYTLQTKELSYNPDLVRWPMINFFWSPRKRAWFSAPFFDQMKSFQFSLDFL